MIYKKDDCVGTSANIGTMIMALIVILVSAVVFWVGYNIVIASSGENIRAGISIDSTSSEVRIQLVSTQNAEYVIVRNQDTDEAKRLSTVGQEVTLNASSGDEFVVIAVGYDGSRTVIDSFNV